MLLRLQIITNVYKFWSEVVTQNLFKKNIAEQPPGGSRVPQPVLIAGDVTADSLADALDKVLVDFSVNLPSQNQPMVIFTNGTHQSSLTLLFV